MVLFIPVLSTILGGEKEEGLREVGERGVLLGSTEWRWEPSKQLGSREAVESEQ